MKKFLVVVDMQHDFIDGSLGSEDAENRVLPNVIEKIKKNRENGDYLIFTRDTHYENYLETFEGKHLPVEHCIEGTKGWEIHTDIQKLPVSYCPIVDKPTFGSLNVNEINTIDLRTEIESYLDKDKEFEIELCGLCTDICVISNALILRAIYPNVKITVDSNACGGTSKEAHEAALMVMKSCQIEITC